MCGSVFNKRIHKSWSFKDIQSGPGVHGMGHNRTQG